MKKYTILVDMDNTINDTTGAVVKSANNLGIEINRDIIYNNYDISKGFIIPQNFNISNPLDYIFKQKGFWYNIDIYDGAQKVIDILHNSYNIVFATTPYESCVTCKPEKIEWLKKYFWWFKSDEHIIFSDQKWNLDGEMIIEDKPETLIKCKEKNKFIVKVNQGYNRSIDCDLKISDWDNTFSFSYYISEIDRLFWF